MNGADYLVKEKLQDDNPANPKTINLLKGGIVYSDAVNAVSPSYAKEILTSTLGIHIDATLRKYKAKVSGILNGIDLKTWNPGHDRALPEPYSSENSTRTILEAKKKAREIFVERFHLIENRRPWVGSVTRLVPQKGPELIEAGIRKTVKLGGTFLLLGASPVPEIQAHFNALQKEFLGNKQVLIHFEYDEEMAHRIYAALDFLLVPSISEPCGLTQLIAMRYGTIPIVRATGGLKDTVFDCENSSIPVKERNGFVFEKPNVASLDKAIERAVHFFLSDSATFQAITRRAMQFDFGWEKPAQQYLSLFKKIASPSR